LVRITVPAGLSWPSYHIEPTALCACATPCITPLNGCPAGWPQTYRAIKQASDSVISIPSQCIIMAKAGMGPQGKPGGRMQYIANVILKINVKIGGSNCK
jgi:hypothetical protein